LLQLRRIVGRVSGSVMVSPRKFIGRLLCIVALGALLSACDRCGDWWWQPGQSQMCKPDPIQPR
jgi:hypothetical protein